MSKKKTTHYTNFGVQGQPAEADRQGFLHYREGFQEKISQPDWTKSESWIDRMERAIEKERR